MDRRLNLDEEIRDLQLNNLGYQHTYFEPPEGTRMEYDAIVYKRQGIQVRKANNKTYGIRDEYLLTVISRDPETPMPEVIQEHFMHCVPGRFFVSDNLYHFPFTIFY